MYNLRVTLLHEYIAHRNFGLSMSDALELIRSSMEALPREEQREIVGMIRECETDEKVVATKSRMMLETVEIPALSPLPMIDDCPVTSTKADIAPALPPDATRTFCPQCGTPNKPNDFLCKHCGFFIEANLKPFKTVRLHETASQKSGEYFDPNAQLVFHLRHVNQRLYVRPQDQARELVMGRSDADNISDIDLATLKSLNHGVSRRHLAIGYDAVHHVVTACDLNSVNGSFINGQRIFPKEVRILRDNDELRLGKLLVGVYFERQFARSSI